MTPQEILARTVLTAQFKKLSLKPTDVLIVRLRHSGPAILEQVSRAARSVLASLGLDVPVILMPSDMSIHQMDRTALQRCLQALIAYPENADAKETLRQALSDEVSSDYVQATPAEPAPKRPSRGRRPRRYPSVYSKPKMTPTEPQNAPESIATHDATHEPTADGSQSSESTEKE